MKLDKLILVNWGSLRTQEYPMGNMTLLTGPTGAGKSTMLDAMQTVMTAVYSGIFNYNPGQEESNQNAKNGKTKRTLWSYIVGAEDNLYARPNGAHGYIAAVFKPSEGEECNPFTAIIAASARVDGSGEHRQAIQEKFALLIIDDNCLVLEDLIDIQNGELTVIPVDTIESHLKLKFRGHVNYYRDKREYLSQLYGRFRGRKSGVAFPEAMNAAKAWVQAIAQKEIGSIDQLVRNQILDHDPQSLAQRITQISDLMRQVSGLRNDGERLKGNISRLELVEENAKQATKEYEEALQLQLMASKKAFNDDDAAMRTTEFAIHELESQIRLELQNKEALVKDQSALQQSQIQLAARLQGMPAAEQKRGIEERLNTANKLARTTISTLLSSIHSAKNLQNTARHIIGMQFPANFRDVESAVRNLCATVEPCTQLTFGEFEKSLSELNTSTQLNTREMMTFSRAFEGADNKFEALYASLTNAENSFATALHTQIAGVQVSIAESEKKEKELSNRKANLAQGGADYPNYINVPLKRLRSELPGARTQVLCDLIEPASDVWHSAIEGYMGAARFNFVVDPEWEAKSIEFLRKQGLKANIIQGSMCLKNSKIDLLQDTSIVHELHTEHPIARAYLVEQYGGVVKVPDAETLRFTPRGLTQDGKASGGRAMFNADEKNLVFGAEAKRQALERTIRDHAEVESQLRFLREQLKNLQALLGMIGRVSLPSFTDVTLLDQAARDIDRAKEDLSHLDLTEIAQLEAQRESLAAEMLGINEKLRITSELLGGFNVKLTQNHTELARLTSLRPGKIAKVESDRANLQHLATINTALSNTALEAEVDGWLEDAKLLRPEILASMNSKLNRAQARLGDLREALADFNHHAKFDERFDLQFNVETRNDDFTPHYRALVQIGHKVRDRLMTQREIGLVKNLEQLRTAEASFKDVFTKQFCYEIRNTVDNGVKTLKALNIELEKMKFGTDKFRLDWSAWVPEFKEYYDFFCAAYDISEMKEVGDLFGSDELSAENCRIRDRLVELLLSDDQERALKELQRISDYRNYRQYEIWKESDSGSKIGLSKWGTGSGGQLETPAYIIRAAVVTNRLKHFEKGINLKFMVNDESFQKMDDIRSHDVIRFLRDNLGMQLILAMPTKGSGSIKSEFTKEWSFSRTEAQGNGEVGYVSEADERDLRPDKMRGLWEERRQQIRQQATIAFDAEEPAES